MTREQHIVHIVGTLQGGGVQRLILGITASPALSGYKHSVLCVFGASGDLSDIFQTQGINAISCPFPWPEKLPIPSYRVSQRIRHQLELTFPYRLAGLLKQIGADLVHTHVTSRIDLQAKGILSKTQLPWIWTLHGMYNPEGYELQRWTYASQLMTPERGIITADSSPIASDLASRGLQKLDNILVVYPGADVQRFRPSTSSHGELRTKLGIQENAVLVGTAGRLDPVKGHDILISAASLLSSSAKNIHIVIAGSGPFEAELQNLIRHNALSSRVHLIGFQEDVPAFLNELDVFVLPSRSEGFPLALIEALASGLPCIATDVGGVTEMLGYNGGIVVPSEEPNVLARAIETMQSPDIRKSYSQNGPTLASKYSYDHCANHFAKLYRCLIAGRLSHSIAHQE